MYRDIFNIVASCRASSYAFELISYLPMFRSSRMKSSARVKFAYRAVHRTSHDMHRNLEGKAKARGGGGRVSGNKELKSE
jgi:hypothetical protein